LAEVGGLIGFVSLEWSEFFFFRNISVVRIGAVMLSLHCYTVKPLSDLSLLNVEVVLIGHVEVVLIKLKHE
jgi:hypothetical protein